MPEPFDVDELLEHNPQIDRERLEEARELHRRLREAGVRRKAYDLAPPFGGRRASVREDAKSDSRVVQVRLPGQTT